VKWRMMGRSGERRCGTPLLTDAVVVRVVSSKISGGKILEIYSSLSGNFRKFVKDVFTFYILAITI